VSEGYTQPRGDCRFCGSSATRPFVDIGMSPLCETFLTGDQLDRMEPFYPLSVFVCERCLLVQLKAYVSADEIFTSDYGYFSSFSDSWLEHATRYCEMATRRFDLGPESFVVELASNDGYLLRNFVKAGIPCLGIEPSGNVAEAAQRIGVPTQVEFFGVACANRMLEEGQRADLVIGNNVLAQVPDLNDFVAGIKVLMKADGVMTLEFPHLLNLIRLNQFDTIYHEHFSYFSWISSEALFARHGITLFDVEELPTHGGSLRIFGRHADDDSKPVSKRTEALRQRELTAGLGSVEGYAGYAARVERTKRNLLAFLIEARNDGKRVAAYGAPGKGNTLLNYCGIRTDLIDYAVDRSPLKQGRFTPGTHIPIHSPEMLETTRPDYILIMPWNLREEIATQLCYTSSWGARLVVAIPELDVFEP